MYVYVCVGGGGGILRTHAHCSFALEKCIAQTRLGKLLYADMILSII